MSGGKVSGGKMSGVKCRTSPPCIVYMAALL